MDFLEISKLLLTSFFSIIGIIASIYTALHSLNKQSRIDINKERLEFVYYPLMNEIKSFSYSNTKGFDLYYYLYDKMKDEKYRTLLGSKKLEIEFRKLSRIFSEDTSVLNSKEISKIYSNMYEETMKQYRRAKLIIGYDTDYFSKFLYCIAFVYANLLLFATISPKIPDSFIMNLVSILWCMIILLLALLSIVYATIYLYKEYYLQLKESLVHYFKALRVACGKRKRKKEK